MTIYVDSMFMRAKVGRIDARWCHMFSDQIEQAELHAFAQSIGLKRSWFQPGKRGLYKGTQQPDPSGDHYDVTKSVRAQAVAAGAIEVDRQEAVAIWRSKRKERPTMTILDDFDTEVDAPTLGNGKVAEPTGRYDRYILPRGDGQSMEYTRTTTLVGDADGSYGVMTWQKYRAVWGAAQRDELIAQLRSVGRDDKATIREVCAKAELIAGTESASDFGTAAHNILQRVDEGLPIEEVHEYWRPLVSNYQEALRIAGIEVIPQYVERTCRFARYDVAGKPDNIYQLHDGSLAIGDKKTTADIERAEKAIASQLAVYANCEHMMNYETGRFEDMPPVRKDFALIILISTENFAVTIERIDIQYGLARTRLMVELREANKAKHIRHPYIAPGHWDPVPKTVLPPAGAPQNTHGYSATAQSAQVAERLTAAVQAGPVGAVNASPPVQEAAMPAPQPPTTVGPTPASAAPPRVEAITPTTHVARPMALTVSHTGGPGLADIDRGMASVVDPDTRVQEILDVRRNDKPRLQHWAKALGCTDLAHHRKWLAEWIVKATPGSGAIEPSGEGDCGPGEINSSQNYGGENPRSHAEAGLPPAPPTPPGQPVVGPGTSHPIQAGVHAAPVTDMTTESITAQIRSAPNLPALNDIWKRWTEAYGREAWSGEVKEHADARAALLRAQVAGDDGPPF